MADETSFALTVRTNGAVQTVKDIQNIGTQVQKTAQNIRAAENQIKTASDAASQAVSAQGKVSTKAVAIGNFIAAGMMKAAGAVKSLLSGSVAAYGVQEQAEAKLGAALKATGYAAGLTQKQLEDYASSLQDMTTYGDEVTLQSMTMLTAFKNIKGDNFKAAQLAAMDMAAAMGKSLPEATKLFGASLNNPIEGISKLKESGIQFTKAQIAEITKLTNIGRIAEAQAIILAEAQARWGGSAAAAAKTATGQMQQVMNAFGDIKEGIAGVFMKVISLTGAGTALSKKFSEWASYLKEHMLEVAYQIADVALQVAEVAEIIIAYIKPVWTVVSTGIQNIVIMGVWLYDNWSKLWENMGSIAGAVGNDLLDFFTGIFDTMMTAVTSSFTLWGKILSSFGQNWKSIFSDLWEITKRTLASIYVYYVNTIKMTGQMAASLGKNFWALITGKKSVGDALADVVTEVAEAGKHIQDGVAEQWKGFEFGKGTKQFGKDIADETIAHYKRVGEAASKIGDGFGKHTKEALKKAGVSDLNLQGMKFTVKEDLADVKKRYQRYHDTLDKNYAAAQDEQKSKSLKPAAVTAEAARAEQKKFAGIAEKGSNEAWKTILANQKSAKPEIAVAEKQLEAQNQIKESVDKVTAAVKETANQSPGRKTDMQSAERAAKGDSYTRAQSKKTATPEKQLKVTEEIRDILREISKSETMGAFAI